MERHAGLAIGALVIAKRESGVCRFGEAGVCYEHYRLDGRPGWSILFAGGRHDGFSPDEVASFLHVTDRRASSVVDYRFRSVGQLAADYEAGRFAEAFASCHAAPESRA